MCAYKRPLCIIKHLISMNLLIFILAINYVVKVHRRKVSIVPSYIKCISNSLITSHRGGILAHTSSSSQSPRRVIASLISRCHLRRNLISVINGSPTIPHIGRARVTPARLGAHRYYTREKLEFEN